MALQYYNLYIIGFERDSIQKHLADMEECQFSDPEVTYIILG